MSPVKHSFSYSYLLTGIPVGLRGTVGGMISIDEKDSNSWLSWKPWYTVNGDNYLARGHHPDGLQGKLSDYLRSQGVDSSQYSYAYLLTAAKFLGYSSNPVSIWLLYATNNVLQSLILEVNNTFDERHNYFLASPSMSESKQMLPEDNDSSKSIRYSSKWPKEFYVSTFNDRSGSYSLSCTDPFAPHLTGDGQINLTITLSDPSHLKPMIVTRLFSTIPPLDPVNLSLGEKTRFLTKWWWVGFATFPRTLREAYTLFFCKKMPWAFRPEPRRNTTPRHADETEICIESQFRAFLKFQVEQCDEPIAVRYKSAGLIGKRSTEIIFYSRSHSQVIGYEIRVLTPLFYSRIVQYAFLNDGLKSESSEGQTLSLSDEKITNLLQLDALSSLPDTPISHSFSYLATVPFTLLNYLRIRPSPIPDRDTPSLKIPDPELKCPMNSSPSASALDKFVLHKASFAENLSYIRKLMRLMLANHVAFGLSEIFDFEMLVVRVLAMNFFMELVSQNTSLFKFLSNILRV
ncbi:hypothetical protein K3495_g5996 [Podosphaera aphanis]|nr:hypothetical protein K3495_g5996 [Podosphaera aphanis]